MAQDALFMPMSCYDSTIMALKRTRGAGASQGLARELRARVWARIWGRGGWVAPGCGCAGWQSSRGFMNSSGGCPGLEFAGSYESRAQCAALCSASQTQKTEVLPVPFKRMTLDYPQPSPNTYINCPALKT